MNQEPMHKGSPNSSVPKSRACHPFAEVEGRQCNLHQEESSLPLDSARLNPSCPGRVVTLMTRPFWSSRCQAIPAATARRSRHAHRPLCPRPRSSAATAALAQLSVPAIAAVGGALLLLEPLSQRIVLSTLMTIGGIAFVLVVGGIRTRARQS